MKIINKVFFLSLFVLLLSGCKQQDLLVGLNQNQANQVIALLQENNIQSQKDSRGKDGYSILIDEKDFVAAVDLIETYQLPSKSNIEIEDMFPTDALISSPRAEKARLLSAIEQRLGQTLTLMSNVVSARVHVSYPLESEEGSDKIQAPHVSALIMYNKEVVPSLLISNVKRLLKNSFSEVDYDNISVILSRLPEVQQRLPIQSVPTKSHTWIYFLLLPIFIFSLGLVVFYINKNRSNEKQ
jgi:type III secretion protein J